MVAKEYCCYTRPYSSIEGFQLAHTLYYSASVEEEGTDASFANSREAFLSKFILCFLLLYISLS